MPWKSRSPVDLRKELMERLAQKERVTDLCREYGVSRKTVNKFKTRFERLGLAGLEDQSRAPKTIPHKTPPEVEEVIIVERKQHPTSGPKKLKEVLERRLQRTFPSAAAIGSILARNGLAQPRRKRQRHVPCRGRARGNSTQRRLVHRLQGTVPARRCDVLLPADDHGPVQPLHPRLRGHGRDLRRGGTRRLRGGVPDARTARREAR